jgi:hypothetical protein
MAIAGELVAKHIPAEANSQKNRISIARQRSCKHGDFRGVSAEEL